MVKIMLVDDSNLMVSVLRNFIKKMKADAEFVEAHNGEEAVAMYKEHKPKMVFLDIVMPIKNGLEALEEIRAADSSATVVMCTSLKEAEQEQKARSLGAVEYITKPFSSDDIKAVIDKYT